MRHLLVITFVLGLGAGTVHAQSCPAALPVPASWADIRLLVSSAGPGQRCPRLGQDSCDSFRAQAFSRGLITAEADVWMQAWGLCPMFFPGLTGIFEICAVGCFTAGTPIPSVVSGGDTPSDTAAEDVCPRADRAAAENGSIEPQR